jgi:RNA polymerase sigma-70 factor (ECF subfamily)
MNPCASDGELVLSARGGDNQAVEAIQKRYQRFVRSKLVRLIGAQDVDDHTQEVFCRLFQRLGSLVEPTALRGFLIGIARRVACAELRRRRRCRLSLTATGDLPELHEPWRDAAPARQALARLEAILESLGPRTREIFVLRYVDRLETNDVAAAVGTSLATAKRRIARASRCVLASAQRDPALAPYVRLVEPSGAGSDRASVGGGPMARALGGAACRPRAAVEAWGLGAVE